MRKLILLCCAMFIAALTQAQIEKGDVQLGGSLSFRSSESGDFDNSAFTFAPQAGLFVSSTTSIGLQLGFTSSTNPAFNPNNGQLVDINSNLFAFGVYARFHKPVVDNLYLFLQPAVAFGSGKVEQISAADIETNTFNIGVSPGITYFLSPKFALEMNLGGVSYNSTKADASGTETTSSGFIFDMDLGTVGLGLNFYIR